MNIYLNIIWAMTWDIDISALTQKAFAELLSKKQIYIDDTFAAPPDEIQELPDI